MAKREKFIIIVAILAVLGYVGSLLFAGGGDGGKSPRGAVASKGGPAGVGASIDSLAQLQKSIDESQKTVSDAKPEEIAVYVVANSDRPFPQDPFYFRVKAQETESETVVEEEVMVPSITLIYTGFIQVGRKFMAIINGLEYEIGDDVAGTGFLLRSIRPDRIEIVSREGKYSSQIPFVEEGL
ncbi:MAG: hypothetical protein JEZ02_19805 [Desulfatibacillum sp.]|nr:hypothetical protein [Desulfatibacillum sp.]